MDTILRDECMQIDHSRLHVLLTQLKKPLGTKRDAWHASPEEPDDDIRHYDDPDDDAVDENTANLTGHELELMKPWLIRAIEMLRRYDYSMFPDIQHLHATDPVLARSMASFHREKCQLALAALSTHDYNAARRHLRYVIQFIHRPARNLGHRPRSAGAARRTH
jgi:hypothetical protein